MQQLEHVREILPPVFLQASPVLTADQVATLIESAYWSSLLVDEGRMTRVRMAVVSRASLSNVSSFSMAAPFDEKQIAKLAPAVPPEGASLSIPIRWRSSRSIGNNRLSTLQSH